MQKGGDTGRYNIAPSYFGDGTSGYHETGSTNLSNKEGQMALSRGVIHPNGMWAGPNLKPMNGGGCGCSGRRGRGRRGRTRRS